MRNLTNPRSMAAIAVAFLGFSVFSGIAKAGHDPCHALVGSFPGSNFGPSCHFEAQERGEFWTIAFNGGWEVSVTAVETPNSTWFAAGIGFPDGTDYHVNGRPDTLIIDPLLSLSRLQTSFEVDGSVYELNVELYGEEAIQYSTSEAALLLYRNAGGQVSISRDSQRIVDLEAGGQLRRFVSARFGVGVLGCLGPICP